MGNTKTERRKRQRAASRKVSVVHNQGNSQCRSSSVPSSSPQSSLPAAHRPLVSGDPLVQLRERGDCTAELLEKAKRVWQGQFDTPSTTRRNRGKQLVATALRRFPESNLTKHKVNFQWDNKKPGFKEPPINFQINTTLPPPEAFNKRFIPKTYRQLAFSAKILKGPDFSKKKSNSGTQNI